MLQIRDIETPFERDIDYEDGTKSSEMISKELYYTVGRERAKPCSDDVDIVEANISMLTQCANNKKSEAMPRTILYKDHEYRVSDSVKLMLRDKIDIYEEGELFNCECNKGLVKITIDDAQNIRRQIEDEEQVIILKYKSVIDKINSLKTMEDVETFNLNQEWVLS